MAWPSSTRSGSLDAVKAEGDVQTGVNILRRALEEPLRIIAQNAGRDGGIAIELVRRAQEEQKNANVGYDVLADSYVDMVGAGIVDPAKVTRSAVENAASIAGMILTTEALITDKPEKAGRAGHARRWHGRHGRHGRHGLLVLPRLTTHEDHGTWLIRQVPWRFFRAI